MDLDSNGIESATAGFQIKFAIFLLHPKLLELAKRKLSVKGRP
jgi:hypothetical protein